MSRYYILGICLVLCGALQGTAQAQSLRVTRTFNGLPGGGTGITKEQLLKNFDKNRDGRLDTGELSAWRNSLTRSEAIAAGVITPGSGKHKEELLSLYDLNGDGRLTKEESAAYRTPQQEEIYVGNWIEGEYLPPVPKTARRTGVVIPRTNSKKITNMYKQ